MSSNLFILCFLLLLPLITPQIDSFFSSTPLRGYRADDSIPEMFTELPRVSEVNQMIVNGDELAFSKLLQLLNLRRTETQCESLLSYSNQIIGKVEVAIYQFTYEVEELNEVITQSRAQILKMEQINKKLKNVTSELDVQTKKQLLQFKKDSLNKLVEQIKSTEISFKPTKTQIFAAQKEIELNKINIEVERQRLELKTIAVLELDSSIEKVQKELSTLKNKRTIFTEEIEKGQEKIKEYEEKIAKQRQIKFTYQRELETLEELNVNLRKTSVNLNLQINQLKTDISVCELKQASILRQLSANEQVLGRLMRYSNDAQLQQKLQILKKLTVILKKAKIQNDDIYYQCYGYGSVERIVAGQDVEYAIKGLRIGIFLSQIYGDHVSLPQSNFNDQVRFNKIDILSYEWFRQYGSPFYDQQSAQKFEYAEDFSCLSSSRLISGNGMIKKIEGNTIMVKNGFNMIMILKVGMCSRFEVNGLLPSIGETIYFKGILGQNGNLNIYFASVL